MYRLIAAVLVLSAGTTAPQPAAPILAITGIAVVDAARGTLLRDRTILVERSRIVAIGPASSTRVPADARVLDGSGRFLIPGLWDMHAHAVLFGPTSLTLYLANGVTGIRDMGAERFADAKSWRDRIAAGSSRARECGSPHRSSRTRAGSPLPGT
jgi:imidazolonepropionase-like amidohydrolase